MNYGKGPPQRERALSPSEGGFMEPYTGLFLSDRAHRHNSNLALRHVHKRFDLDMTPFDAAQGLGIAGQPNLAVLVRYSGVAVTGNLGRKVGWLLGRIGLLRVRPERQKSCEGDH
jgi:hypothetical protein